MKTWKVPISWRMIATIDVEADTLAEAIEYAKDEDGVIPIPDNGIYEDSSWQVDEDADVERIRFAYNRGQPDGAKDNYKEAAIVKVVKNLIFDLISVIVWDAVTWENVCVEEPLVSPLPNDLELVVRGESYLNKNTNESYRYFSVALQTIKDCNVLFDENTNNASYDEVEEIATKILKKLD